MELNDPAEVRWARRTQFGLVATALGVAPEQVMLVLMGGEKEMLAVYTPVPDGEELWSATIRRLPAPGALAVINAQRRPELLEWIRGEMVDGGDGFEARLRERLS